EASQRLLHLGFRRVIEIRSGLVENEDTWFRYQHPRKLEALTLADRKSYAAFTNFSCKPVRQAFQSSAEPCREGRCTHLHVCRLRTLIADVVGQGPAKNNTVCGDDADRAAHGGRVEFSERLTINGNHSGARLVQ